MNEGYFCREDHKVFMALLYYSAVRKGEALRAIREQFKLENDFIIFSVGTRLKHGMDTPPLNIPISVPFGNELWGIIEKTEKNKRVFPYCSKTAWNIVSRILPAYPHFFRLSRITNFFLEGWNIAQVHSWTGLSLKALDYYLGIVNVQKMGESLAKKKGMSNE
jgi:integrase